MMKFLREYGALIVAGALLVIGWIGVFTFAGVLYAIFN